MTGLKEIYAFYLPQYHQIPENDEFWGEGFTDWENVKAASKIYDWQFQPRIPLGHSYYDPTNVEVLEQQAKLAASYSIAGFCFYHYWFNGRLVLERPAELLRSSKINIKYHFCWANEPWSRTWDGRDKEVLIPQTYGQEDSWRSHFEYLLPFFKDERYTKERNMPLMLVYNVKKIVRFDEMKSFLNKLARAAGFGGIHFVECLNGFNDSPSNASSDSYCFFEPNFSLATSQLSLRDRIIRFVNTRFFRRPHIFYYRTIVDRMMRRKLLPGKLVYRGVFPDWDNTPRKGNRGVVFRGVNLLDFERSLMAFCSDKASGKYLYVNAWNEWAEGAHLEPDETLQFSRLQVIKNANAKS